MTARCLPLKADSKITLLPLLQECSSPAVDLATVQAATMVMVQPSPNPQSQQSAARGTFKRLPSCPSETPHFWLNFMVLCIIVRINTTAEYVINLIPKVEFLNMALNTPGQDKTNMAVFHSALKPKGIVKSSK